MNEMTIAQMVGFGINGSVLAALSIRDIKEKSIHLIPLGILGIFNTLFGLFLGYTAGQTLGGMIPGAFGVAVSLCTKGKLGLGDGLVLMVTGIFLGWEKVLAGWLIALILTSLTGIVLIIMKKACLKTALPFVPFIFAGLTLAEIAEKVVP
ncbi:MAG: prepilin peptidase [Lachnospiraceae bacterium]|nr:prepilin peptidase [Lachnospiraceae bacterium]